MAAAPKLQPELSRLVPVDKLVEGEVHEAIIANAEERAALARRFGLLALDRLEARLRLDHGGESLIRVTGRFEAEVIQACVVSLEPVHNLLEEAFSALYTLAPAPVEHDIVIDPETEEPPEPAGPRGIDLGEAVAQQLALALDPYPRAPGAKLAAIAANEASGGPEENYSFAVLKTLKRST